MARAYNPSEDVETLNATEEILREHVGAGDAITSGDIADQLDAPEGHDTNPRVRDMIRELIAVRQVPVGSGQNGYFLIDDEDDLNSVVEDLESRADAISERAARLERAGVAEGVRSPGLLGRIYERILEVL